MLRFALVLAALLASPPAVSARTWHINPDGTGDAPTIQAGIDSTAVGDTVELACGTYYESGLSTNTSITLRSSTGYPECAVLDFGGAGPGLNATLTDSLRVEGLTFKGAVEYGLRVFHLAGHTATAEIRHCTFEHTSGGSALMLLTGGGGVAETTTIEDCTFRENENPSGNGTLAIRTWGTVTIRRARFLDNTSDRGGAIHIKKGTQPTPPIVVCEDSVFERNTASYGGAIYAQHVHYLTLHSSTFTENTSALGPGGAIVGYQGSGLLVEKCLFEGNYIADSVPWHDSIGGAIWNGYDLDCTVIESVFRGNRSSKGSAIQAGGPTLIQNCEFYDNIAGTTGGADNGAGTLLLTAFGVKRVEGCTFVGNAGVLAHGIVANSYPVEVANCIFAFGRWGPPMAPDHLQASSPQLECSDLFGNEVGDWVGSIADQSGLNGNLSADPLFCNPDAGDYHLQWGSPCLPANSPEGCGLIGTFGFGGCNSVSVTPESWARVKARYR